ncbi:hypothetical protein ACH0C8_16115, partial [Acetobacter lovaniensis]|uniref:hypothetical protein n=1 Tax=Acetobacter lovaniensis TaxID=104100 RepID=UPI00376FF3A7
VWLLRASVTRPFLRQLLPLWMYVLGLQVYLMAVRGQVIPEIWYCVPHALLGMLLLSQGLTRARWQRLGAKGPTLAVAVAVLVLGMWIYRA